MKVRVTFLAAELPFLEPVAHLVGQLLLCNAKPLGGDRFHSGDEIRYDAVEVYAKHEVSPNHRSTPSQVRFARPIVRLAHVDRYR